MSLRGVLFFITVLCCCCWDATVASDFIPDPLPAYCNADYESVAIAPMSDSEMLQVTSLKQVLVMIRHGSRTPYAAGMACWEDYDVQWSDCNVTDLVLPSPALYNYSSQARPERWLFRLIYDAFPDPPSIGGYVVPYDGPETSFPTDLAAPAVAKAATITPFAGVGSIILAPLEWSDLPASILLGIGLSLGPDFILAFAGAETVRRDANAVTELNGHTYGMSN